MRRLTLPLLLLLTGTAAAAPPDDKNAWSVDDVVNAESASAFQMSPDGKWLVWVKARPDKDKGERIGRLVRSSLSDGQEVALTRGSHTVLRPRWSPDGKRVAFLTNRPLPGAKESAEGKHTSRQGRASEDDDDKFQVWLIDPFGGEPWPLTEYARSVELFDWAGPDTLLFAAPEERSHHEQTAKDRKDTSKVVEDPLGTPPARLFKVDVKSRKITRLSDNEDRVEFLQTSPDGQYAVTMNQRSLSYIYDNKIKPVVYLHDLKTGKRKEIFNDPRLNIQHLRWAPDSKGVYAEDLHSSKPQFAMAGILELYHHDLDSGKHARLDLHWDRGLSLQSENGSIEGFVPTREGLVALLADGVRNRLVRYKRTDAGLSKPEPVTGEHAKNVFGLEVSPDGKTIVYAHTTASVPTQWYRARFENDKLVDPRPLTKLNEEWAEKLKARVEVVRWKGALDEEVEGLLYYPHGHEKGKKYPLVVMIHGGPAAADFDAWEESWAYPANHFCQRGAFVFKPNYHGSANYGLAFVESIVNRYYDLEVPDIEKGVDHLIARGLVDPDKLGVLGWSNGSILTIALTTHTTRYKAAAAGAGDVDWVSDWGNCEFGAAFDTFYFGKSVLEDPETYIKKSPFFRMEKVRTPTLILFGSEDRVVPTQQGWMHYRALQQLGKTDVRFLLFPGEAHGLNKLAHQRRKLEEELRWFDRHLFGTFKESSLALKDDSPLAWALKRQKARMADGRYGVLHNDLLTPEVVSFEGRQVGRFEVTAAQFAAFDRDFKLDPRRANHPVTGIGFDRAKAYCEWLSKLTNQRYRLPTAEEADEFYDEEDTGKSENTLDHWAGYAVNPDDAARLRQTLAELGPGSPLLSEVGRFRGRGKVELVYDLGGNVAEWTVGKDGKGQVRGGSADTPADAKRGPLGPSANYTGFRVVREEKR